MVITVNHQRGFAIMLEHGTNSDFQRWKLKLPFVLLFYIWGRYLNAQMSITIFTAQAQSSA
jgi:hypothetical protein